jgi:hypothetical protein
MGVESSLSTVSKTLGDDNFATGSKNDIDDE